jgi:hypothetical protein
MFQNQGKPFKNSGYSPTLAHTFLEMGCHQHGFLVGLPLTSRKHDSIWVVVDRLTKTTHFIAVNSTYSTKDYAEIYLDRVVRLHGIPKTIISDRGPQFIAHFLEQLHETWEQS